MNISDYFNDMKKSKGYTKCQYEDLDPFNDCKPVNCELKYFGKRNFFKNPSCVPAKVCDQDLMYNYETNECRDWRNVLSEADIKEMESGQFSNWNDASDGKDIDEDDSSYYVSCYIRTSWGS